ncbi:hypothetical protein C8F04DRAFT_1111022 [Mycena alexandri]|uniref:Uncharacterized protein n=1 Tax=Mycena alexandri TaxID=1745969 RepID=A0AAD6SRZ2_9AGAR|nr:hypothetical protein C8F04DRAFT_1111022 [Mycena alexandri]
MYAERKLICARLALPLTCSARTPDDNSFIHFCRPQSSAFDSTSKTTSLRLCTVNSVRSKGIYVDPRRRWIYSTSISSEANPFTLQSNFGLSSASQGGSPPNTAKSCSMSTYVPYIVTETFRHSPIPTHPAPAGPGVCLTLIN